MRTWLLIAGILIPVVYFANLFGVGAMTPFFDHGASPPSELGREGRSHAALFNAGLIVVGVLSVLAATGLFLGLRHISGGVILAGLTMLSMLAFGVSMLMAGAFPLPNPLHYGFNIILLALLTPLFGALALKGGGADRWIVLAGFVAGLSLLAINAGVGGVASASNIGWIVRAHGAVAMLTFAYLCWAALRRA
jgi:hypothetical membrane protein